jgi:hypothetical protein
MCLYYPHLCISSSFDARALWLSRRAAYFLVKNGGSEGIKWLLEAAKKNQTLHDDNVIWYCCLKIKEVGKNKEVVEWIERDFSLYHNRETLDKFQMLIDKHM